MFDFLRNLTKSAEEKRQEAITAYLDDTMSANERERFAAQLAQDPELQAAVARERAVKQALRQLPQRRVPRNFTLDPARYGRPAKQPLIHAYPALRAATGLAGVFFVFALFAGFYLGGASESMAPSVQSAGEMIAMDTAVEQQAETTRIVTEAVTAEEAVAEEPAAAEPSAFEEALEAAGGEPAATAPPAAEAATEEEAAEAPAPAASEGDGTMQNGEAPTGGEDTPSPMPTPTMAAAATATAVSTATAQFTDRPITTTMESDDARETDAGEIALAATALPLDEFAEATAVPEQQEPPSHPLDTLLIIQVGLLLLLIILGAITLYTRRQL